MVEDVNSSLVLREPTGSQSSRVQNRVNFLLVLGEIKLRCMKYFNSFAKMVQTVIRYLLLNVHMPVYRRSQNSHCVSGKKQ